MHGERRNGHDRGSMYGECGYRDHGGGLETATGTVVVSGAAAPTAGQVLTATSGTAADWQTPSGGSGGLSELFKFHTTASNNIGNNVLIPGLSYEIAANSLAAGTSFRVSLAIGAGNATEIYLDTVSGTEGTVIGGGTMTAPVGNVYDVICLSTGAGGLLLVSDIFNGNAQVVSVNTTVNNYIEAFNVSGGSAAFQNYAMVVIQT